MINDFVNEGRSEGSVARHREARMDKTASNTRYAEARRSVDETTGGIRSGTQRLEVRSRGSLAKCSGQQGAFRTLCLVAGRHIALRGQLGSEFPESAYCEAGEMHNN